MITKTALRELLTNFVVWLVRPRPSLRDIEVERARDLRHQAHILWADMRTNRTITERQYQRMGRERIDCINEANRLATKHHIPELIAAAYAR